VTITHTISSSEAGSLDASSTINVVSDNFNLYNINVANGYGKGAQAVALTANGDKQGYYGCQFDGYQDT
jgi:pectinesterase